MFDFFSILHLIVILGIYFFGMMVCATSINGRKFVFLSPEVFLLTTFFLYSSSYSIATIFFGREAREADLFYVISEILAYSGILFGIMFSKQKRLVSFGNTILLSRYSLYTSFLISLIIFMYWFFSTLPELGGNFLNIFEGYGLVV